MSKRIALVVFPFLLLLSSNTGAQTWDEWFRQKKTQRRYLVQQIAALKVYGDYVKKGYDVASTGLGVIRAVKGGELGLHQAFFASLKSVSPVIKENGKVAQCIALGVAMGGMLVRLERDPASSPGEREYIDGVGRQVRAACARELAELLLVVTSGGLELTDDERLRRLDDVHRRLKEALGFTRGFLEEVQLSIRQKTRSMKELDNLRQFYDQ